MSQPAPTAAWAQPSEIFPEVALTPYLAMLDREFGIPPEVFAAYQGYQPNRETIWIVQRAARLPKAPRPFAAGLPFFYYRMRFPRPTTPTVLRWGHLATRNVYDLDEGELAALFAEQQVPTLRLDPAQIPCYQMLRHRGRIVGVAIANFTPERQVCLFPFTPKTWRFRLDHLLEPAESEPESEHSFEESP